MYDELIKRIQKQAVYLPEKFSKNAELLDVLMKAADAIEAQDRKILTLQHEMMAEAESHTALVERLNKQIEVISKMEKTTKPDNRLTPKKPKAPVDTWVCPECGRDVEFQAMLGESILFHGQHNFCPNCGSKKPDAGWTCSCGNVNTGNFCTNCGSPKPN